jgi:hypothetical protein
VHSASPCFFSGGVQVVFCASSGHDQACSPPRPLGHNCLRAPCSLSGMLWVPGRNQQARNRICQRPLLPTAAAGCMRLQRGLWKTFQPWPPPALRGQTQRAGARVRRAPLCPATRDTRRDATAGRPQQTAACAFRRVFLFCFPSRSQRVFFFLLREREREMFIGTQFSNLYTLVDTSARGRVGVANTS